MACLMHVAPHAWCCRLLYPQAMQKTVGTASWSSSDASPAILVPLCINKAKLPTLLQSPRLARGSSEDIDDMPWVLPGYDKGEDYTWVCVSVHVSREGTGMLSVERSTGFVVGAGEGGGGGVVVVGGKGFAHIAALRLNCTMQSQHAVV